MPKVKRTPSCSSASRASLAAVFCMLPPWRAQRSVSGEGAAGGERRASSAVDHAPVTLAVPAGARLLRHAAAVGLAQQREVTADPAVALEPAVRRQRVAHAAA